MTDTLVDHIRNAHDDLKAGIERLKVMQASMSSTTNLSIPDSLYKAMHALSYAVKAVAKAGPFTTEQLDNLQFGRSLHDRPDAKAEPLREDIVRKALLKAWNDSRDGFEIETMVEAILALAPPAVDRAAPITWQIAQIIRETIFVDKAGVVCDIEHCSAKIATTMDRAAVMEECAKIAESSCVSYNGTRIGIGIATKIRDLK